MRRRTGFRKSILLISLLLLLISSRWVIARPIGPYTPPNMGDSYLRPDIGDDDDDDDQLNQRDYGKILVLMLQMSTWWGWI